MSTEYQQKHTVAQLLKSAWDVISSLNLNEGKANDVQDHLDAILSIVNDQTKDIPPPTDMVTVDTERKARRTKKETKKKDVVVDVAPKKEEEPLLKATRGRPKKPAAGKEKKTKVEV